MSLNDIKGKGLNGVGVSAAEAGQNGFHTVASLATFINQNPQRFLEQLNENPMLRQNLGAILKNADNSQIIDLAYSLQSTKILHPITNVKMLVEPFSQNVAIWMQHESIQFQQNPHHELKSPKETFDFFKKMIQEEEFIKLEKKKKEELVRHLLELNKINKETMDNFIALQKMSQQERKLAREAIDKIFDGKELNQKENLALEKHLFGGKINNGFTAELNNKALLFMKVIDSTPSEKDAFIETISKNENIITLLKEKYPEQDFSQKENLKKLSSKELIAATIASGNVDKADVNATEYAKNGIKIVTQYLNQVNKEAKNKVEQDIKTESVGEQKNNRNDIEELTNEVLNHRNINTRTYNKSNKELHITESHTQKINNQEIETLHIHRKLTVNGLDNNDIDFQILEQAALEKNQQFENKENQIKNHQQLKM